MGKIAHFLGLDTAKIQYLKREYGAEFEKKRDIKHARQIFDMREKGEYVIDDITAGDLDIDSLYAKLDRTYSSAGECSLYSMLRTPIMDEEKLKKREKLIDFFNENPNTRAEIQYSYYNLGRDRKNTFLDMMKSDIKPSIAKYYIYTVLGKVIPIILIALAIILNEPKMMIGLMCASFLNMYVNQKEKANVRSVGIIHLRGVLTCAKELSHIKNPELKEYVDKIKTYMKELKGIDRSTMGMSIITMWGGLLEVVSVIFLIEESSFYKLSNLLKENKAKIIELYYLIGEMEALIAVANYKTEFKDICTVPKFKDELSLKIDEGAHPLIKNAVANTLHMKKNGMILTGTNMSGKSTFLRMLGINILLAETFYFALAKKYEASFFNIVSSISPSDDLEKGKSFYMVEAESLLRIINAMKKDVPVFCAIDEIFRGTNPIERIAASAEILSYINNGKSISIVTTHDRELVDILKDKYEFHYFSEKVDKEGLKFDYKLKDGVSKTRNAIRLLEHIGYPKDIIENSFKRAEKIEGFI